MDDLASVDDSLVRLRRIWSTRPRQVLEHGAPPVEMSSVLVVEACARGAETGDEVTISDVAGFAAVEHSTASRLTERAVRSGFVTRAPSAHDARRTALTLTPSGWALRERSARFRMRRLATVVDSWSRRDVAELARLLGCFASAVAEHGRAGSPAADPTSS